jgi:hypothetical protein
LIDVTIESRKEGQLKETEVSQNLHISVVIPECEGHEDAMQDGD